MKYFFISSISKAHQPQLQNWFSILNPRVVNAGRYHEIPELTHFDVSTSEEGFGTDVIDAPFFLISAPFFKVASMYDEDLQFKKFRLHDPQKIVAKLYLLPTLPHVDALSDWCEYRNNGAVISRVVLDKKKIKYWHISKQEKEMRVQ